MGILGLFIQKLGNLQRIQELRNFGDLHESSKQAWQLISENLSGISSQTVETLDRLPIPITSLGSGGLTSLINQNQIQSQTYDHLVFKAAISYWLSKQKLYGESAKTFASNAEASKALTSHL